MGDLEDLLKMAKKVSPANESDREAQRRSFAYGNTNIENDRVTRQIVDSAAEKLRDEEPGSPIAGSKKGE